MIRGAELDLVPAYCNSADIMQFFFNEFNVSWFFARGNQNIIR